MGASQDIPVPLGASPLSGSYLVGARPRSVAEVGRRGLAARARLVGRGAELAVLTDAVRAAVAGTGGAVVVAGEPGIGKTRLVSECREFFMGWVGAASGRLPLWLEGRCASYASSTPYGAYQQLLCRFIGATLEAGEAVLRPALGSAVRAVSGNDSDLLPVLAHMMGMAPGPGGAHLGRMGPAELQHVTFAAVRSFLAQLVSRGPTVLALEDLHWADPTSLHLTQELSSLAMHGPLLLVLTRRPEPDLGVSALEAALIGDGGLKVRTIELAPLAPAAERVLARALLGGTAPDHVVDAVSEGTDGNPLFLEERLGSLLDTHALVNTEAGGWQIDQATPAELPDAIERLVRSRVDRLGPDPHDAIVAASVLGPEFALGALAAVSDLDRNLVPAVSELCSAGLLVEVRRSPEPYYRFRHALIQEATYQGLLRQHRRQLHARAAWGLEQASVGRSDDVAGVLGHHYALAGEPRRVAHYLELAGDHAAAAFANEEALASYRWALDLIEAAGEPLAAAPAAGLWLKLEGILERLGRFSDASDAARKALTFAADAAPVLAARCHFSLARLDVGLHRVEQAFASFDTAESLLRDRSSWDDDDWALWFDMQRDRAQLHYWRNEPDLGIAVLERAEPLVEERGTPRQKAEFHSAMANQRFRKARFLIDNGIVDEYRTSWAAAVRGGLQDVHYGVQFSLGLALLCQGDLLAAQAEFEGSLRRARRVGDRVTELRCLTYLAEAHLRQHDVGTVSEMAPQTNELASTLGFPEYVGMATAMMAWVAWREGNAAEVEDRARQALENWRATAVVFPFHWICLWPLTSVRLAAGQLAEAVEASRQMLAPAQQRFPDDLQSALHAALDAWEVGEAQLAGERLGAALDLATRLRYA